MNVISNKYILCIGSIYADYKDEAYYFEIIDLLRRLLLSGGLILMGSDSVGQIFLGIVVCAFWLVILVHLKPYKSEWDNFVAITLAANLVLTIVSGMALKLYKATPSQSENQQVGFGFVLIGVSTICIILSIGTTLASIPYVQKRVEKCRKDSQERKTKQLSKEKNNDEDDNSAMPFKNPMHIILAIEY